MKKPTEPPKPIKPTPPWFNTQVREQIGPLWDGDYDEPYYPEVTIATFEEFAEQNGIEDPRTVKVTWRAASMELEMYLEGEQVITQEMRDEAQAEYEAALKKFEEVDMPAYREAKARYESDLRAYYKWQHDRVGNQ